MSLRLAASPGGREECPVTTTKAPAGGAWVVMSRTPAAADPVVAATVRTSSASIEQHLRIEVARMS